MTQALAEMEMDETRDGRIEFDEFLNWWQADSATKAAGSLAFRLQVSLSLSVSLCLSLSLCLCVCVCVCVCISL